MTTELQRPSPQRDRLAALLELAREQDECRRHPRRVHDLDYPELVILLEAEARRQRQRRRRQHRRP